MIYLGNYIQVYTLYSSTIYHIELTSRHVTSRHFLHDSPGVALARAPPVQHYPPHDITLTSRVLVRLSGCYTRRSPPVRYCPPW